MKKLITVLSLLSLSFLSQFESSYSQFDPVVTLVDNPSPGYLLFDWPNYAPFKLLDNYGDFIQKNDLYKVSNFFYPLANGKFAILDENKAIIFNEDIVKVDTVPVPSNLIIDFHDFISLANGRYLFLCNEQIQVDMSGIAEGGQKDAIIFNNVLLETDRSGTIYWIWSAFNHLNILDATSAVDLTQKTIDFCHINSLFETPDGDILVSIRHFDEVALIDKSTGNFKWRLGGSKSKRNEFSFANDSIDGFTGFSHQHTATMLSNGNILLFDNGNLKPNQFCRAVEYSLNTVSKIATKVWEYYPKPNLVIPSEGSAYRLPNGNTLIGFSQKYICEVRPDNNMALKVELQDWFPFYRAYKVYNHLDYVSLNINSTSEYNFNNTTFQTGIRINVKHLDGTVGLTHLQKHQYSPRTGNFKDTTFSTLFNYRWIFTQDYHFGAISGEFILDPKSIPEIKNPQAVIVYKRDKEAEGDFEELPTVYDSVNHHIVATFEDFGEFVIGEATLPAPQLFYPANGSYASINGKLRWQKAQGAKKYQVQIATNGFFNQPITNVIINDVDFLDYNNLNYNQIYYWRLRSISRKDTSEWSDVFVFKTHVNSPALLYPENNFVGMRLNDSLKWSSVEGANRYQLQVASNNDLDSLFLDVNDLNVTYFSISNFDNNNEYIWRVRAFQENDSSAWSNYRKFVTVLANTTLVFPANDSKNLGDTIKFTWKSCSGAVNYALEIATEPSFVNTLTKNVLVVDTSIILTNFEHNTKYYWRIKAQRYTDSSDWSAVFNFTTKKEDTTPEIIETPIITNPKNNSIAVPVNGVFVWNNVENAIIYRLLLKNNINSDSLLLVQTDTNKHSIDYNNIHYNTLYFLSISAANKDTVSEISTPIRFITELEPPVITYPVNGLEGVPKDTLLTWVLSDKQKYEVQIARDAEFTDIIDHRLSISDLSLQFHLFPNSVYYCRVKSYNDSNYSQWSEIVRFKTQDVSSITSHKDSQLITIYPNPAKNILNCRTNDHLKIMEITVYDILGAIRIKTQIHGNQHSLDISSLQPGVYCIIINKETKVFIKE